MIVAKFIRQLEKISSYLANKWRITYLQLKYPGLNISDKTQIGRRCNIICVDGGKMILDNVYIANDCTIFCSEKAILKMKGCFLGHKSTIVAREKITIAENCEIAELVIIRDQNHKHNLTSKKIATQGFNTAPIMIESNVWIGAKATILKGVTIGTNSVVGAHTLVNKSIPISSVAVGIPAKLI